MRISAVLATAAVAVMTAMTGAVGQAPAPSSYARLRYRYIGPPGNRTDAVTGVPGDPSTYYSGAAAGGIFKTTDGGLHWHPIFDAEPVMSIGALAVAPSDHNIVWAGTGEAFLRSHISIGAGIFKSTDAGATWKFMGLKQTGRISRIVIDPRNPNTVLACALGTTYGPQPDRGVFRSTDGGATWTKTLFVNEDTGCSGLAMDLSNPRILFAGMWQYEQHTWGQRSGGPSSGLYKSTDGGATWTKLSGHGLPHAPLGKINVAIAPSDPQRVYAMIETGDGFVIAGQPTQIGVLWMSDDDGATWTMMSSNPGLQSRTHYYNRAAVSSDNPNEIYFLGNSFLHSLDGGRTLTRMPPPGGDNHDMWIDPTNANNMAVANDSGVSITHDRGAVWNHIQLPIAQMYHVSTDNAVPYHVFGNKQDGSSYMGPSQTGMGGGFFGGRGRGGAAQLGGPIPASDWHSVGGGESGWAQPDPVDPNIVWSSGSGDGSMGGIVTRMDLRTGQIRNVEIWPDDTLGSPAAPLKYRFMWEFPLSFSPFDHNTLYAGSQYVHVTHNGGQSWQVISPDLTLNEKGKQGGSGGLTQDNIGAEYFDTIFSIAESPKQQGLIWVGTNDGLVQLTRDGGKSWTNLTQNLPGLPQYATISSIQPSLFDAATAYLTVDGHLVNNRDPYVYRTTDYGATWTKITAGLPIEPNGYAHQVIEDPSRPDLLFLGTEGGVYVSFNAGDQWQPLQLNLPHVPVYGLTVQNTWHDLVLGTYGRGFWILDDITPLEKFAAATASAPATLFPLRAAYEFRGFGGFGFGGGNDNTIGNNPPAGADLTYYLPQAAAGRARIAILDAAGQTVRTLPAPGGAGMHRLWWDLRGAPSAPIRVRTVPAGLPSVTLNAQGWRNAPSASPVSLLYPPGAYTVQLRVDGQDVSQPLTVLKDPRSPASPADFAAQFKLASAIRGELNQFAGLLNQAEALRVQLHTVDVTLQMDRDGAPLRRQADGVDGKLVALETKLYKNDITGQGEDEDRQAPALGDALDHLFGDVTSADYPPTDQELQVNQLLIQRLAQDRAALGQIVATDVVALNTALGQHKMAGITTVAAGERP
ncbi:MAG TPA: hypothetical protein VMV31_14520 [Terriglobales bacterium]|nr:hypothetical protein [Terriglobales bacterium]